MNREETYQRTAAAPQEPDAAPDPAGNAGLLDDPRIVKSKRSARGGDAHTENRNALLFGGVGIVLLLAVLYFLFF